MAGEHSQGHVQNGISAATVSGGSNSGDTQAGGKSWWDPAAAVAAGGICLASLASVLVPLVIRIDYQSAIDVLLATKVKS